MRFSLGIVAALSAATAYAGEETRHGSMQVLPRASTYAHSNEILDSLPHAKNVKLWSMAPGFPSNDYKTLKPENVVQELLSIGKNFFKLNIEFNPDATDLIQTISSKTRDISDLVNVNASQLTAGRSGIPLFSITEGPSISFIGGVLPEAIKFVFGDGLVGDNWNSIPSLPASKDPLPHTDFYYPAASAFQGLPLGGIIAWRKVALSTSVAHKGEYQVSFRTDDTYGNANADVATVLVPAAPGGQHVVYGYHEDAVFSGCLPSYTFKKSGLSSDLETLLGKNWIVTVPDTSGTQGAFNTGIREGRSMLNAIRAVHNLEAQFGISIKQTSMWGYSGGSYPAQYAAEILSTYAPEIVITAVAVGGVTPDKVALVNNLNGGPFAGFLLAGFQGFVSIGTEYANFYKKYVKSNSYDRFNAARSFCSSDLILNYIFEDIWSYFTITGPEYFATPEMTKSYGWLRLGSRAPQMPYMVYHGINDEIMPIQHVDTMVDEYCKGGTPIDYYRLALTPHLTTETVAKPDALSFLQRTFDGYSPGSCSSHQDATQQSKH